VERFRYVYVAQYTDPERVSYENYDESSIGDDIDIYRFAFQHFSVNAVQGVDALVQIRVQAFDRQGANVYSVRTQMQGGRTRQLLHWSSDPSTTEIDVPIASVVISSQVPLHVDAWASVFLDQDQFVLGDFSFDYYSAISYAKRTSPVREIDCGTSPGSGFTWFCTVWHRFPPATE
jgi:hypothetical protein